MSLLLTRHGFIRTLMTLIALMGGVYQMSEGITGKADIYYVHWAAYQTFEPNRALSALRDALSAAPGHDAVYQSRKQSASNYLVLSATSYLGARFFPGELVRPIVFGHTAALLLAVVVFFLAMKRARGMTHAMGLVIAFYAVQGLLPGPVATDHLLLHGGLKNALNLFVLLLDPGEAFSIVSFWPKSIVLFLAGAVLCLRAEGRLHAGYVILLVAQFFHATLGLLLFAGFLVMDIALRRPQLSWRALLPMLLVSAAMSLRSQWQVFADTGHLGVAVAGIVAVVAALAIAHPYLAPVFARFQTLTCDVMAIVAAAAIAVPASILIYLLSAPEQLWAPVSLYLQVATRLFVFAAFATALWLGQRVVDWLRHRDALRAGGVLVVIACGFTAYAAVGGWWWQGKTLYDRLHNPAGHAQLEAYGLPYYLALKKLAAGGDGFVDRPTAERTR